MASTVEQIKAKLNIVDVVGAYLKLEKAGINYKARCPFHQERTPSFFVSPARDSYYCFGCNQGGDIFTFVETIEGLDFLGALKVLAERAGVSLERGGDFPRNEEKDKLHRLLADATAFYRERLKENEAARSYLAGRGLLPKTIAEFDLGLAPVGWQHLFHFLRELGYRPEEMSRAGLVLQSTKRPGEWYDRFRGRIMFPLKDGSGRTVGFSGRILEGEGAKYINSPQTELYDKSKLLYGYDKAKLPMRRADQCILVEGQMDLLLSHQAGVENTVAVSGTALTAHHLELLRRLTVNLVMAFDADPAGLAAAERAIGLCLISGLAVKLATLPKGIDPADLILKDAESWRQTVAKAPHALDFLIDQAAAETTDRRQLAHRIKREVYPLIALLPQRIDQAHFIAAISSLTGLAEEVIRADLAEVKSPTPPSVASEAKVVAPSSRRERIEAKLFGLWWWRPAAVGERLAELLGADHFSEREQYWQTHKNHLILEAELSYEGLTTEALAQEIEDLIINWRSEQSKDQVAELMAKLAQAERAADHALAEKYIHAIKNIYDQKEKTG